MRNKLLIGSFKRSSQFPTFIKSYIVHSQCYKNYANSCFYKLGHIHLSVSISIEISISALSVQDGNCQLQLTDAAFRQTAGDVSHGSLHVIKATCWATVSGRNVPWSPQWDAGCAGSFLCRHISPVRLHPDWGLRLVRCTTPLMFY